MGLQVVTNEVHAHLAGCPVEVFSPPMPREDVKEIRLAVGERKDGAVGCTVVLHGTTEQLRDVFESALAYCVS